MVRIIYLSTFASLDAWCSVVILVVSYQLLAVTEFLCVNPLSFIHSITGPGLARARSHGLFIGVICNQ